ncbi:MAG: hypothetical protein AAGF01_30245 [Cyanobacteria bacterium P01_G01_bin.38]
MDIALLVKLLAPCLPFLLKLGNKATEAAAEKVGEQSAEKAGQIWNRLWPKVKAKEAAKEAAEDVAKDPEDGDSVAALRRQLKKILENDADLASEIEALLKEAEADPAGTWVQQTVTGDKNQVIGVMSGNAKAIGSVEGDVTM